MAARIVAYFDWCCVSPVSGEVLSSLERAMRGCADLLGTVGLLGSVGDGDVWAIEEEPLVGEGVPPAGTRAGSLRTATLPRTVPTLATVVRRVDLPEVRMLLGQGSSAMDLSLVWGIGTANRERRGELSRLVMRMAEHFPVTEVSIAPHGLEASANVAFEKVCEGRDFAEVRECLLASKYAWGFRRDGGREWRTAR